MDYARIYNELIADRRAIPPSDDEYTELHHIVPRCMGGDDRGENLVRLRPEDHFFAHLLLAKAYHLRALWAACVLMSSGDHRTFRFRYAYGMARRKYNEISRGVDAPNADRSVHTFFNVDGREWIGTRIGFGQEFGIPAASVNSLFSNNRSMAYGWSLERVTQEAITEQRKKRASEAGKQLKGFVRDKAIRHFFHRDSERSIIGTQIGFQKVSGLTAAMSSALCVGSRIVSLGWCLAENADWAYDIKRGLNAYQANRNIFDFENEFSKETVASTIFEMGTTYNNGDNRPFGCLIRGQRFSWRGWRLAVKPTENNDNQIPNRLAA